MSEYIDREVAIEEIEKREYFMLGNKTISVEAMKIFIRNRPAADVAPVRHGRWVDNHCTACGIMPIGDEIWEHCDLKPPRFDKFMDYCPNCGAKMDLEENE